MALHGWWVSPWCLVAGPWCPVTGPWRLPGSGACRLLMVGGWCLMAKPLVVGAWWLSPLGGWPLKLVIEPLALVTGGWALVAGPGAWWLAPGG